MQRNNHLGTMCMSLILSLILLIVCCSSTLIASQTIVKTLPGYSGPLPFKLETGYIGVGEDEAVQLFYYFVESEGNPEEDPLIIWLAGGPGCSTLRAFFYEIGPMRIQYGTYMDNVPALQLDPNSWTKVANVIYLDAPTLVGYSYTTNPDVVRSSDTASAMQTAEFLRKFVRDHPKFLNNPMYVTGISYSGIVIPIITEELYKGNDEGLEPKLNIQGYMGGNPLTDKTGDINSRLEYAYRVALISDELFEATKKDCNGDYAEADNNNLQCLLDIDEVNQRVGDINIQQILDPDCDPATNLVRGGNPAIKGNRRTLRANNRIRMLPARSMLKKRHRSVDETTTNNKRNSGSKTHRKQGSSSKLVPPSMTASLQALHDDNEVFPISDEKYAEELQLQEALIHSASLISSPTDNESPIPLVSPTSHTSSSSLASSMKHKEPLVESTANEQVLPLIDCGICMDSKTESEMFKNINVCSHMFCSDCISKHVAAKIKENLAMVRCPLPECKGLIGPEVCKSIVPKQVLDRWEDALCESLIMGSQKYYCPFKDCSAMLVDDGGVAVTSSECPFCNRLFCAQCRVAWHCGMDCSEYKSLKKGEKNPEDLMLMDLAKSKKWMRCPSCRYYVERTSGCLHISCRCGHHFCYQCGKENNGTSHTCAH